jgi:hypothetical protein
MILHVPESNGRNEVSLELEAGPGLGALPWQVEQLRLAIRVVWLQTDQQVTACMELQYSEATSDITMQKTNKMVLVTYFYWSNGSIYRTSSKKEGKFPACTEHQGTEQAYIVLSCCSIVAFIKG